MHLMAAQITEFKKEFPVELHAAVGLGIELYHPALNSVRIELYVPRRIKRVRKIDPTSVAAQLHHLGAAVQGRTGILRMARATHDTSQMHGTCLLGMKRVRHVVLQKFSRSPTGNVKEAVVERQIDVGEQRRQCFWIGCLGRNVDHFRYAPFAIVAMPNPKRSGQIFQRYHYAKKSISPTRIVRRAKLESHLV